MAEGGDSLLITPRQSNLDVRNSGKETVVKRNFLFRNNSAPRYHRASLGSSYDGASSGRNSSAKPGSPNSSHGILPRYLSPSTGSCHDFCKYGRKHAFEENSRRSLSKSLSKPSPDQPVVRGSPVLLERKKVEMVKHASSDDTNTHLEKHKPSFDPNALTVSTKFIKDEVSLPTTKVVASKQESETKKRVSRTARRSDNMSMKRSPKVQSKAAAVKTSPFSGTLEGRTGRGRRNGAINDGKSSVPLRNSLKDIQGPSNSSSSSRCLNIKTMRVNSRKNTNLKLVTPLKDQDRIQKSATVKPKNGKIPEESLDVAKTGLVSDLFISVESRDLTISLPTSSNESAKSSHLHVPFSSHEEGEPHVAKIETISGLSESVRNGDVDASQLPVPLSPNEEDELHVIRTERGRNLFDSVRNGDDDASPPNSSDESVTSSSHRHVCLSSNEEGEFYVVKTEILSNSGQTDSPPMPSNQSPISLSNPHEEEEKEEEEENGFTNNEAGKLIGEEEEVEKNRLTYKEASEVTEEEDDDDDDDDDDEEEEEEEEAATIPTGNNDEADLNVEEPMGGTCSRSLKKGKAVGLKEEHSSLMKLKFRRGKVVELQSDNNTPRRLRFRRGRVMGRTSDGNADVRRDFKKRAVDVKDDTNPTSETVVLRHQDVQDNKNALGLFNNVIEETASKLVESRKSKVKALVGAFETVISLQDSKPSSDAAN